MLRWNVISLLSLLNSVALCWCQHNDLVQKTLLLLLWSWTDTQISQVSLIYIELFLFPGYVEKLIAESSLVYQRQSIQVSSFLIIFCYQGKGRLAWAKYKASWEPLNINFGVSLNLLKTNLGLKSSGDLMTSFTSSPVIQCVSYFSLFTFVIKKH